MLEENKAALIQTYNKLKSDYSQHVKKYSQLDQERRQHMLVLNNLSQIKDGRRMWKMMGGILVQKSAEQITKILQETLQLLSQAQAGLSQTIKQAQKKIMDYELKVGLRPQPDMKKK